MAAQDGLISKLSYRESVASPGSYTDVLPNLFAFPEPTLSPETLPIADGIDLRVRDRDEFVTQVYDISLWAALNTLMVARAKLDVKFTFGTPIYTFNPCRFTVRLLTNNVPDRAEVLIGATDAGDDVAGADSADWTSLGEILGGSALNLSINTTDDGLGLPFYVSASLEHTFDLMNTAGTSVRTTLASYNRLKCRLAWKQANDDYLFYENVTLQHVPYALNFGLDQLITDQVQVSAAAANTTSLITLPASPVDYITGFELRTIAASAVQGDYLTVA